MAGIVASVSLAIAPFSGFLYRNRGEASFEDTWRYGAVFGGAVLIVVVGIALSSGKQTGSRWSFLLGWGVFALFWFRDVESFADDFSLTSALPARGPVTWAVATLVISVVIHRFSGQPWFPSAAAWFAVTIVALPLVLYALFAASSDAEPSSSKQAEVASVISFEQQPDIYFLMLDGLARQDVLDVMFDIDISEFVEELRRDGFIVADRALGAHPNTLLSFPAVLEQDYQVLPGDPGPPKTNEKQIAKMAGANRTQETLRANGYHFISAGSGELLCNPSPVSHIETCVEEWFSSAIHQVSIREQILHMTPFLGIEHHGLLPESIASWLLGTSQRWNQESAGGKGFLVGDILDAVESVRADGISKPLFIAAHMKHTHPPFTLDEHCNYRDLGLRVTKGEWDDVTGYQYSIECAAKQIRALIDHVDPSAVIVLQSDHGPVEGDPHSLTDFGDPDGPTVPIGKVWARAAVFSAVRLPAHCRSFVPDTYAGVTTFKVVFGCLSGNLEIPEPEKTYWTWYWDHEVLDLTDRLREYTNSFG